MDIKISELSSINQADLEPDDIFLVVRGGRWTKTISASQLYRLSTDNITDGILDVKYGGVGADLSQTGGTKHYVKQLATGAGLTTGIIQSEDLPTSLRHIINIGGTNTLSLGTVADSISVGSDTSDDYIYGSSVAIYSDTCRIDSDSILFNGSSVSISTITPSDVIVGHALGTTTIRGNVILSNQAILPATTLTGALRVDTIQTAISNNAVLYSNSGMIQGFSPGTTEDVFLGYGTGGVMRTFTATDIASQLSGTVNVTANINAMQNGSNVATVRGLNFAGTGVTVNVQNAGTYANVNLSVATADNTASKLYMWSNYR